MAEGAEWGPAIDRLSLAKKRLIQVRSTYSDRPSCHCRLRQFRNGEDDGVVSRDRF